MSAEAAPNPTTVVADVGATFVRAALSQGTPLGPTKERRAAELHRGGDDGIVPGIVGLVRDAIAAGFDGKPTRLVAAGIGVRGAVDDSGSPQRPAVAGDSDVDEPSGPRPAPRLRCQSQWCHG